MCHHENGASVEWRAIRVSSLERVSEAILGFLKAGSRGMCIWYDHRLVIWALLILLRQIWNIIWVKIRWIYFLGAIRNRVLNWHLHWRRWQLSIYLISNLHSQTLICSSTMYLTQTWNLFDIWMCQFGWSNIANWDLLKLACIYMVAMKAIRNRRGVFEGICHITNLFDRLSS